MNEGSFADFYTLQGKMVWWFSLRCADRIQTRLQGTFPFKYEKGGKRLWQRLVTWPKKTKFRECTVEPGLMATSLTKKPKIQIFSEFLAFRARFRQIFQIDHKRIHLLENWVTWLSRLLIDTVTVAAWTVFCNLGSERLPALLITYLFGCLACGVCLSLVVCLNISLLFIQLLLFVQGASVSYLNIKTYREPSSLACWIKISKKTSP